MHFDFQKIHFLKLQINGNKFPIKIKKCSSSYIISDTEP